MHTSPHKIFRFKKGRNIPENHALAFFRFVVYCIANTALTGIRRKKITGKKSL